MACDVDGGGSDDVERKRRISCTIEVMEVDDNPGWVSEPFMRQAWLRATVDQRQAVVRAAVKADRSRWIEEQLDTIASDLEQGSSVSLWALVRTLSGRRRRKAHVAAAVIKGPDGRLLGDSDEINEAWRQLFLK